ncbi:MAG: tagaturonate reductase [Candidatus Helarchaeota archaeon]|nr:tagaturonate reductase [Candidatus Helarchaeota archaeon]
MLLTRELLSSISPRRDVRIPDPSFFDLPVKVIQFGEGRFIRAFLDYFIEIANHHHLFNGRVVVIQPQQTENTALINAQNGLFTLCARGLTKGLQRQEFTLISSIKEAFAAKTDWLKILSLAERPSVEFIVSNTTEAGLVYNRADLPENNPPASFPGKVLSFLYRRFQFFDGNPKHGLKILPLELIENNGMVLRDIILKLARSWELGDKFIQWLETSNRFYNSIVDRIVTGYPAEKDLKEFQKVLGYEDKLFDVAELYHSWIIEAADSLQTKIPFDRAGLNVEFVSDLTTYFQRKVRILNGAHTSMTPIAYLSGKNFVKESIEDPNIQGFVTNLLEKEVIPFINLPAAELIAYKDIIFERFHNPFIEHKLLNITLYSTSKMRLRLLPSIIAYYKRFQSAPLFSLFAFAAFLTFMRIREHVGSKWSGQRGSEHYEYSDSPESLQIFHNAWNSINPSKSEDLHRLVSSLSQNPGLWNVDLSQLPGFVSIVTSHLEKILHLGMVSALQQFLAQQKIRV